MTLAYAPDPTGILIGLLMAIPLLGFLGIVGTAVGSILKEHRECQGRKETEAYRKGFRAAYDFMEGKAGLPEEIVSWPDALKEIGEHDY